MSVNNLYIIAGNSMEYRAWLSQNPQIIDKDTGYRYVSDHLMMCGLKHIKGRFIGTWYKRSDIGSILAMICVANSVTLPKLLGNKISLLEQNPLYGQIV